jgi:hypothetical protein
MLTLNPHERPSIIDVHNSLRHLYREGTLPKSKSKSAPSKTATTEAPRTKPRITFSPNLKR